MCGIIGYNGSQDPKGILLDGLKRLEYRGYDSAGIAALNHGKIEVYRSEGRLQNLEKKLTDQVFSGGLGIGHTRWATHGAPTELNAHPHRIGHITLVHNGIIENYLEQQANIQKMGRTLLSETDSEIVAHLLDIEVEKGKTTKDALLSVLPNLRGSYALVILNDLEPDVLIGVRNGAPLLVGVGETENYLASDVQAILHRTNKIIYLADKNFAVCHKNSLQIFDLKGGEIKPDLKTIHWTPDQLEKAGYRHYMLKEIFEQPQAIANTIEGNIDHEKGVIHLTEIEKSFPSLKNLQRISIVACGTARHAALVGKYYIEQFARIPVDVDFGSEFRYRDPILDKNSLTVLISQSGETADTLAALRESSSKNVLTLSVCNVRESSLTRESDIVLYTDAGPEIGVASTKAFTTQLVTLYMLALQLGQLNGKIPEARAKALTQELLRLPLYVTEALKLEKEIEQMSIELQEKNFFFFMGRDLEYPIALEGALKLKEISYAHAEGYPAGELKHGPIALIDRNTAILVLAPRNFGIEGTVNGVQGENTIYEKVISNLQEVKARGGVILSIGSNDDQSLKAQSKYYCGLPKASWAMNPILASIPLQLFAYHVAVQKGTDVDKPRNLAKSVTVE